MTGYETVMAAVLGRLKAAPTNWGLGVADVRRTHRTAVPREKATAVHLIDGTDKPRRANTSLCALRDMEFTVSLFIRRDDWAAVVDGLKTEAYRRLSPDTAAYADGVRITPGEIAVDPEIADADAIRVDLSFAACYSAGEWML